MKRIFIVDEHQSSKQNGVGTYIRNLLNCFEGAGHEVTLLSFNSDEKEFKIDNSANYAEYHIPVCANGSFLSNGVLSLTILRLYIEDDKENVFFVCHSPCLKFLRALQFLFPKSKRVFIIHDQGWTSPLLGSKEELYKVMNSHTLSSASKEQKDKYHFVKKYTKEEMAMYKNVHEVICLCQGTKSLLTDLYHVPEHKITVIPNGIAPIERHLTELEKVQTRERLGILPNEIVLLYVGRISEAKGVPELLKAFETLWHENHKLRLVIAGQMFNLNDYVKYTPDSCTHITYTGLIAKDRLNEWYEIADIGILPSYTEQCSYTGIELMAHGKVIVTTDGNNLQNMFTSDMASVAHIDNSNKGAVPFEKQLERMIDSAYKLDWGKKQDMCQRATERFQQQYTINVWREKYIRLISG